MSENVCTAVDEKCLFAFVDSFVFVPNAWFAGHTAYIHTVTLT